MSETIAELKAVIGGDTKGLHDALSGARGALQTTQGAFSNMTTGMVALGTFAGGLLTKAISTLSTAVGGLGSAMIGGNAEFERYQVQFTVLLGSAAAAKERLAELTTFAATTPFELPEVVKADKILQSFGLHADDVKTRFGMSANDIRTVAGDVAAGTGSSFEEISTYLGKFASGATGESLARLQELGVVTKVQLAKMGLAFDKAGSLTTPVDKSMTVLLSAMKDKFGGMMVAQSGTFEGMQSNLSDWIGQTARKLGQPIFEVLKTKLQGVLDFLARPETVAAIDGIATRASQAIGGIADVVTGLSGSNPYGTLTVGAYSFLTALGMTSAEAQPLAVNLADAAKIASGFFNEIVGGGDASAGLANGDLFQGIVNGIRGIGMATGDASIIAFAGTLDGLVPILNGLVGSFEMLWADITAGAPIGELLGTFVSNIAQSFGVSEGAAIAFGDGLQWAIDLIGSIVNFAITNFPAVRDAVVGTFDQILAVVTPILESIGSIINTAFTVISQFLSENSGSIESFISGAWARIQSIITSVGEIITLTVVPVWEAIAKFISDNQETIKAVIQLVWNGISAGISNVLAIIDGVIKTALKLLKGDWKGAWETIEQTARDVWANIKGFFDNIPGQLTTIGKNIIEGIVKGLESAKDLVLATLGGIVDGAIKEIKKRLGISSPSAVFAQIGTNMMAGLANGIESASGLPEVQLAGVVGLSTSAGRATSSAIESPDWSGARSADQHIHIYIDSSEVANYLVPAFTDQIARSRLQVMGRQ